MRARGQRQMREAEKGLETVRHIYERRKRPVHLQRRRPRKLREGCKKLVQARGEKGLVVLQKP